MATRKVTDDALARTAAERAIGEILIDEGFVPIEASPEPGEMGRRVLGVLAKAVQFETGESKDPDRQVVPMRRLVITGVWEVDPDALSTK